MKDYNLQSNMLKEVAEGRVTVGHGDPLDPRLSGLSIYKYTQECHIRGLWNETNRQARGIIIRTDGTIVARPFAKFFNLNEVAETKVEALPWHEEVEVYEKVDGSCGIGYVDNYGCWALATPGSLVSDQAMQGTLILRTQYVRALIELPLDCTPIFEIIYPANRIVVDYKGKEFLSLLAVIEHNGQEWHPRRVDQFAEKCGFNRPQRYNIDLRSEIPFEDNSEGYVARFSSGLRLKVKSPTYLRIHRLLNFLSPKGVIELIRGREYGVTVKQLPPAIACDFDDIRAYVQSLHHEIFHEANRHFAIMHDALSPLSDRKTIALWIQANVPNQLTGFVFALLDGKPIEDKIWKLVIEKIADEPCRIIPQE